MSQLLEWVTSTVNVTKEYGCDSTQNGQENPSSI